MTEIVSAISAGGWPIIVGWVLPALVSTIAAYLVVLPFRDSIAALSSIASQGILEQGLAIALISFVVGLLLSSLQTGMYRFLEGYYAPMRLRSWAIQRNVRRRESLEAKLDEMAAGLDYQLTLEEFNRYPASIDEVAPTRLANNIRALETYAQNRYALNSQALWHELTSVVPAELRQEEARARAGVDFFVSLTYLAAALSLASVVLLLAYGDASIGLPLWATSFAASVPLWYWLAVVSVDNWRSTVQAIVNLGRKPLADSLGLGLPRDLDQERLMWERVDWLISHQYDSLRAKELLPYRQDPEDDDSTG